jgi:hypothetical protein
MQLQGETAVLNIIPDLDNFRFQGRYVAKRTGFVRPYLPDKPNIKNRNKGNSSGEFRMGPDSDIELTCHFCGGKAYIKGR